MSEPILERIQADTRTAMKAGERERVGTLRMIASSLQQDAKVGKGDDVAVLQRERKKRIEAAEAFEPAAGAEQAAAERAEAALIEAYLPRAALRRGARGDRRGGGRVDRAPRPPRRWAR